MVGVQAGAHSLPIEQGRVGRLKVPRHLRKCTFCTTNAVGDERYCVLYLSEHLRQQYTELLEDSHDTLRGFMWHKDQQSAWALVLAIVKEVQTS